MIHKVVLYILLLITPVSAFATSKDNIRKAERARVQQIKKEMYTAKSRLKTRKDLDKSETSLRNLLKDTTTRKDVRVHNMLFEVVKEQYLAGNEKLFLREKYDTAQILNLVQNMFLVANQMDSVDARPNKKGKVNPIYRKSHSLYLSQYVRNLYGGAIYFVNKQNWDKASAISDLYLTIPKWALFNDEVLANDTLRTYHAAFLHLLSNYRKARYDEALKYSGLALKCNSRRDMVLQCLSSISEIHKDTASYLHYLNLGLDSFPRSRFYCTRLLDYYASKGEDDKGLEVVHKVLDADSLNAIALVARQTIALSKSNYKDCIEQGEWMLRNDSVVFVGEDSTIVSDVYYNIGIAYYNQAVSYSEAKTKVRASHRKAKELYKLACPYMERYRMLAPGALNRWRPVLYNIYLNLNLGNKFAEIEKL